MPPFAEFLLGVITIFPRKLFTSIQNEKEFIYRKANHLHYDKELPDLEVIKLFSCSTQLCTKFQLLIKTKITTNDEVSLSLLDVVFIMLVNVKMPTIVGILTFMSRINVVLS